MKWSDLKRKTLTAERIAESRDEAQRLVHDLQLKELRKTLGKTQQELATTLRKKQASLSKMENQSDWMLSTLAEYLAALGANLKVFAEVDGAMYPLALIEEEPPKSRRTARPRRSTSRNVRKAAA